MRTRVLPLLTAAVLVLTACGGGGGTIKVDDAAPKSTTDADFDLCEEFDSSDEPSDDLIAAMPEEHREAMTSLIEFVDAMDAMGDNDADADELLEQLVAVVSGDGLADRLRRLAGWAEEECGSTEGSMSISAFATGVELANAPADEAYCAALSGQMNDSHEGETEPSAATDLEALLAVAPEEHHEALTALAALADVEGMPTDEQQLDAFGAGLGIGIYAEATCKIEGSLAQMLLGAMFVGMGSSAEAEEIPGVDPTQYPDITADAANSLAPSDLSFEVRSVTLDDTYLVSAVVPVGWTEDDMFGAEFSPSDDGSIFTSLTVNTGCDGVCEPSDWEERLRADEGYIGSWISIHPDAAETPVPGSEGIVLTSEADASAVVVRWDDRAVKYFTCEVSLEEEQLPWLAALVAACTSAKPAWFPVG